MKRGKKKSWKLVRWPVIYTSPAIHARCIIMARNIAFNGPYVTNRTFRFEVNRVFSTVCRRALIDFNDGKISVGCLFFLASSWYPVLHAGFGGGHEMRYNLLFNAGLYRCVSRSSHLTFCSVRSARDRRPRTSIAHTINKKKGNHKGTCN